jgi:molybdate transport system substrate-binding protein
MLVRRRGILGLISLCVVALAAGTAARADRVTVAVASNVAEPLGELAAGFEAASSHEVSLVTGSTGKLYAQIQRGAPFDLFLAADQERPALLVEEGLAEAAQTYALGRLVLWLPAGAGGDAAPAAAPDSLPHVAQEALKAPGLRRLAIADPEVAPYGRAAMQALTKLGVLEALRPKLVLGENIGQTYAFVATGNAEAGLVALSQLSGPRTDAPGARWLLPETLHDPIRQDVVLLRPDAPAARAFLDYLLGEGGRAVLARYGYRDPAEPEAPGSEDDGARYE